jgi:polyisoprenoid-binding protein YceI
MRARRAVLGVAAAAAIAVDFPLAGAPRRLELDTSQTALNVRFGATLQTVRGTLGPVSGMLEFDDQVGNPARGEVVVDLLSADTGVDRRDRKMHRKILETDRYPRAVYRLERLDLTAPLRDGRNTIQLHGALDFHGRVHPLSLLAEVAVRGQRLTARATTTIPYVAWGLDDPSYLLLRVAKEVKVEVQAAGWLRPAPPAP